MENATRPDEFLRQVGQAVGAWRRKRQWSQDGLAQRMGMTTRAVAKFESGNFDLRLTTILKLAQALDITPGQLIDTPPDPEPTSIRNRGPLQGLAQTGWTRAKPHAVGAVPVLDLRPRAGRSHAQADPLVIAWASPPAGRHPREPNLFLAQVRGDSMLPTLSDGQWCLFAKTFAGDDWLGQHCLIREVDPSGLTAWSVKRVTAIELGEADQRRLQLTSLNPAYGPRELTVDAGGDVGIEAVLREALSPSPARRERKKPPTENGQA